MREKEEDLYSPGNNKPVLPAKRKLTIRWKGQEQAAPRTANASTQTDAVYPPTMNIDTTARLHIGIRGRSVVARTSSRKPRARADHDEDSDERDWSRQGTRGSPASQNRERLTSSSPPPYRGHSSVRERQTGGQTDARRASNISSNAVPTPRDHRNLPARYRHIRDARSTPVPSLNHPSRPRLSVYDLPIEPPPPPPSPPPYAEAQQREARFWTTLIRLRREHWMARAAARQNLRAEDATSFWAMPEIDDPDAFELLCVWREGL